MSLEERGYLRSRSGGHHDRWLRSPGYYSFRPAPSRDNEALAALVAETERSGRRLRLLLILPFVATVFGVLLDGRINALLPGANAEPVTMQWVPPNHEARVLIRAEEPTAALFVRISGPIGTFYSYARAGETADIGLPAGDYRFEFQAGRHWYHERLPFGVAGLVAPGIPPVTLQLGAGQGSYAITVPHIERSWGLSDSDGFRLFWRPASAESEG